MEGGKPADILFRNGRVIDPAQRLDNVADVLIREGNIVGICPQMEITPDLSLEVRVIDAAGKWIVPGLLDMHVHLREPGEEYKETIATGTRAAVAGGYTSVACMPNTQPVNDSAVVTRFVLGRAREEGACRVLPVAAISCGLGGENLTEFGELRDAGAVAVSDDGRPVMSSMLMRRALEYAQAFGLLVISHAEDLSLSCGGVMNEGPTSTRLGLRGIPGAAEEAMIARDLLLAELTRGKLHIAHVSTAGSVRLIRDAKHRGVNVTAETAPHYFSLTEEEVVTFDPVYKVNPPLRRSQDVTAIKSALADGTIDVIATDHAPHSVIEKDTEFEYAANGIIGLESAIPLILNLVSEKILSPSEAIAKVSSNPSRILELSGRTLRVGAPADLTLIDPEITYSLDCRTFLSKGRNCPFHGRDMKGKVIMTMYEGKIAFSE